MKVRAISSDDYIQLESAVGYLKQYAQNICRWTEQGFVKPEDCYVFCVNGEVVGGVCFCDDGPEQREILDFAMISEQISNGERALKEAVKTAANAETKSVGYNLYNDTEQYDDIRNLFLRVGFYVAQVKKSYAYELPQPSQNCGMLTFRSIAEIGDELFISTVREVTVGILDRLFAADAARLGGDRAAREYIDGLKKIEFNADWWRLGYCGGELVGLIIPQKLSDAVGGLNYVGVLPQHRGHGYGAMLIEEGTRILRDSGMKKIIADIDEANYPMAMALDKVGYIFKMEESVLCYNVGKL